MKDGHNYCVALFQSVSYVIKAEKILKEAGIPHKIIPVPRIISSDCGVCLRFLKEQKEAITEALDSLVEVSEIRELLL
jgi:uncharacterized protein YqgV (UPF0045/DUF77 family)